MDLFSFSDFFLIQNKSTCKLILFRITTGEIVWQSEKLESNSYCLKILEEERKILVGMTNGKGAILKY